MNADGGMSSKPGRPWLVPVIIVFSLLIAWLVVTIVDRSDGTDQQTATEGTDGGGNAVDDTLATGETTDDTELEPLPPYDGWVNPASSGRMWSETVPGLITFRGNPTRSYYGSGPVPKAPKVLWSFPADGGLCGKSTDGSGTSTWCGTGWTGQPSVWPGKDGKTWVAFGAYDYSVHWLDGQTGQRLLPDFKTGDIIKGSVTVDPDGYPLLYTGSRDNYFHIVATDREQPTELWRLSAYDIPERQWNDDWDGSALVIDDYLFEGGENSWFYIYKLNRGYDANGKVTIDPQAVFQTHGWDDQLLKDIGDRQLSIENSVAISGNTVYFANGGGLIQGWDISGLKEGKTPTRNFRFWAGDDIDASLVIDADGFIYAGVEFERAQRALEGSRTDHQTRSAQHREGVGLVGQGPVRWQERHLGNTRRCGRTSSTSRRMPATCSASTACPVRCCGTRTSAVRRGSRRSSSTTR